MNEYELEVKIYATLKYGCTEKGMCGKGGASVGVLGDFFIVVGLSVEGGENNKKKVL